jgi:sodium-dependent dicarboxylate transporter 2/3/5
VRGAAPELSAGGRFEQRVRTIGLIVGPLAALLVYTFNPGGHPPEARRLIAILAFTIVFWMTEAIPLPATALLSSSLAIVLGVAPAREVLKPYAAPIIFLFLGTFLLAEAFRKFALDRRVAGLLLGRGRNAGSFARSRFGRILGIGGATGAISLWISNTASSALMTPIALSLGKENEDTAEKPEQREPRPWMTALLLMVAYGATIGGMATLVGTPPNILVAGFLDSMCDVQVGFVAWLLFGIPIALVLFVVSIVWTWFILGRRNGAGSLTRAAPEGESEPAPAETPAWRRAGARVTLGALCLAVLLWCMPSLARVVYGPSSEAAQVFAARLPEAGVALFCATLLFVVPIEWRRRRFALSWQEGRQINWGILMLFGGGLSLGTMAQSTGVARWVGEGLSSFGLARTGPGLLFCAVALAIVISEFASNSACGTLLVPMVIAAAEASGLDPVRPAIGVGLAATCGFIFPVSTPPNAIVFGTGQVPLRRMIQVGILLDVTALVVVWGGLMLLTPLLPQ